MAKVSGVTALTLLSLLFSPQWADAAGQNSRASAPAPQESAWRLGVALGYGERSNPLIQSDDVPIVVDVDIAWFGERFFFDNGDLGFTMMNNDFVTASLVGRVNSERVFFSRTDTKFFRVGNTITGLPTVVPASGPGPGVVERTVPDRDYAVELGLEALADGPWGMLQFTAFHDVSGAHEGYELFLDYGYGWRRQRWYFEPSAGVAFKSGAMNDYYWGVRPEEASAVLPRYRAGSGTNWHARLLASYQITRHWTFSMAAEMERLNADAAASPIVAERNVAAYFAGFGYRFR